MADIVIDYAPRFPQTVIHDKIEKHRFSVLVCHRRCGKTVLSVNHLIKHALLNRNKNPRYAYLAPFLKQAKLIAWDYLKYYTSEVPDVKIHEGELFVELPNGARIYLFGADNPDALRGMYLDGCILDEYAQMKEEVFTEILRPALTDRLGFALFIGTPKGMNSFYHIYTTAIKQMQVGDQDWYAACYRADETHVISDEELEKLRATLNDAEFRQEMLCDFSSVANDILISIDLVSEAAGRHYGDHELIHAPCIMGVDPARFGDDSSVIIWRQGLQCFEPKIFRKIDNMALVGEISRLIGFMKPDAVFIDAGGGQGIIDRLRQLGYLIQEVNFGGQATRATYYKNKRIEMWDSMKKWLQQGGALPNNPDLKEELVVPTYSFDTANRMQLEPKDKMKERFGKSPDCFVAGTKVKTPDGDKSIEILRIGDEVSTPIGNSRIKFIHRTEAKSVVKVTFSNGTEITGKGKHKVLVEGKGWKSLDMLSNLDTIVSDNLKWRMIWKLQKVLFTTTLDTSFKAQADIIAQSQANLACCIGRYLSITLGKFLMDLLSITRMAIGKIIPYQTSRLFLSGFMHPIIMQEEQTYERSRTQALNPREKLQRYGMQAKKAERGILHTANKHGLDASRDHLDNVSTAVKLSKVSFLQEHLSAQLSAEGTQTTGNIRQRFLHALNVVKNLFTINIGLSHFVPTSVQIIHEKTKTYNLTLDNHNIYFANGIVVQNCADALALTFALPVASRDRVQALPKAAIVG